MTDTKTKPSDKSVEDFLNKIEDPAQKADAVKILDLMKEATQEKPVMWGDIVGFGKYHYNLPTGYEGDSFVTGLSLEKQRLKLYIMPGFDDYDHLLSKLGTFITGRSCLYINTLNDVDTVILKEIITKSIKHTEKLFPQ